MKPKPSVPDSPADLWYMNLVVGHKTLSGMLKEIMKAGNLDLTGKSNHSLRATSISWMYESNVPEKLIMESSSHLSASGVHSYKCISIAQQKALCDTICGAASTAAKIGDKEENLEGNSSTIELVPAVNDTDIKNTDQDVKDMAIKDEDESIGKAASTTKENVKDIMRSLQFSNLTGCTINFSLR